MELFKVQGITQPYNHLGYVDYQSLYHFCYNSTEKLCNRSLSMLHYYADMLNVTVPFLVEIIKLEGVDE